MGVEQQPDQSQEPIKTITPQPEDLLTYQEAEALQRADRGEGRFEEGSIVKNIIQRKAIAAQALARSGIGFWNQPYGEPAWVEIPAGEYWMGSERGEGREEVPRQRIRREEPLVAGP